MPRSEQPATTVVPPPTKGNVHQHVHRGSVAVSSPVAIGKPSSFTTTLSARAVQAVRFKARATRPGEISGPAVKVTVAITNNAKHDVSLGGVTVTCQDAAGTPLVAMVSPPVHPFPSTLGSGRSADGLYVFELGARWRNPLTFVLTNAATRSVVQFSGRVS